MKKKSSVERYKTKFILEELEPRKLFSGGVEGIIAPQNIPAVSINTHAVVNQSPVTPSENNAFIPQEGKTNESNNVDLKNNVGINAQPAQEAFTTKVGTGQNANGLTISQSSEHLNESLPTNLATAKIQSNPEFAAQPELNSPIGSLAAATPSHNDLTSIKSRPDGGDLSLNQVADLAQSENKKEVVFVDTEVKDYEQIIDGIKTSGNADRQIDIVLLDGEKNGIAQITEALSHYQNLDAVHLITHGSDGSIDFGSDQLNLQTLSQNQEAIKSWGSAFSAKGDFLIYGCNVAQSQFGQSFVDYLSGLTGTDIAASNDATGHVTLGADWNLEYRSGAIEAQSAVNAVSQGQWTEVLAVTSNGTVTSTANTNATSLTWAHTVNSGVNRALFVEIAIDNLGANVNSVTYGGVALTQVGRQGGNHAVEIWRLVNPTVGTANVVVSLSGNTAVAAGASTFNGVNQATPTGTFVGNSGSGVPIILFPVTGSVTVASAPGDLVIDAQYWSDSSANPVGSGQTSQWTQSSFWASALGSSSTEPGAASVVMSGNDSALISLGVQWEIGAVSIKAATTTPGITITPNSGLTTTEAGGTAQFSVVLNTAPTANVTIGLSSSDLTEGIVSPSSLTFTAANWNTPQTVTVTGVDDVIGDGNINYSVITAAATSSDGNYNGINALDVSLSNTDDDNIVTVDTASDTIDGDATSIAALIANKGADGKISLREAITAANNTANGTTPDKILFAIPQPPVTYSTGAISQPIPDQSTVTSSIAVVNSGTITDVNVQVNLTHTYDQDLELTLIAADGTRIQLANVGGGSGENYTNTIFDDEASTLISSGAAPFTGSYRPLASLSALDGKSATGTWTLEVKDKAGGDTGTLLGWSVALTTTQINPVVINVGSLLPSITQALIIDGTSQTGYSSSPLITLKGNPTILDGLQLYTGSSGSTIRGLNIQNFNQDGIDIASSNNNTIAGNWFGLDSLGTAKAGNYNGINIWDSSSNIIGGTTAADRNVISGNTNGIWMGGSVLVGSTNNQIIGNYIGTNALGTSGVGNTNGLDISTYAINNLVGGTTTGYGNILAYNSWLGTSISGTGNLGNALLGNTYFSNGSLGIDINWDGPTLNDTGDTDTGANNFQNFPVLATARTDGSNQLNLTGTFNSTANSYYRIEFFASTSQDGTGYGESQTYLGFVNVATDSSGNATISTTFAANVAVGEFITATATKSDAGFSTFTDTSEFGQNVVAAILNSEPVNTVPGAQTTNEDTAKVFSSANSNQISITDADAAGGSNEISLSVTNGTLTLSGVAGLTFVSGSGTADTTMTFRGTASAINTALNGLSYTPTANYNGSATLTLRTLDSTLVSLNIDANLQGRYTFENNANDVSSGTVQNGTLVGNATYITDGTRGQVLTLDGSGDSVQINSTFGQPQNVTIGGWVNLLSTTGRSEFISIDDRVHISQGSSGGVKGSVQVGAGSWIDLYSNQYITGTGWHHVMYVFNGTSDVHTLYIDGVQVATAANTNTIYYNGATTTYIGQHPTNTGWNLNGKVDDVRIYDRALTGSEVAYLASDLSLQDTDTVAITVAKVNDAPTFSSGSGNVTTTIGSGDDWARAMALQSDGKMVVVGYSSNGSNDDFAVARYNVDGSLDSSFGTGGKATVAVGNSTDQAYAVTIQPDGKILVAGNSYNGSNMDFAVIRLNTDGSLDTNFSGDGKVMVDFASGGDEAHSIVVQSDGKIIIGGSTNASLFALARLHNDGSLDTSFGTGGKVNTDVTAASDSGYSLALQSNGKILMAGAGNNNFAVVRYNSDGTLDTSFGTGGKVETDLAGGTDYGRSVLVNSDGSILVSGYSSFGDFLLVKYTSTGALDTSFGGGTGKVTTDISGADNALDMAVQADGKIILGGYNGSFNTTLVRYNVNGSLDTSFGSGGKVTTNIASGSFIEGLAVRPDGRIVAGITATVGGNRDFGVISYLPDGSIDPLFNSSSITNTLDGTSTYIENGSAVILDSNVKIFDSELSLSNFDGAILTLARNGGVSTQDVFSATGTLSTLTQGGNLVVGGVTVGTVTTNSNGTLLLTFNANATQALVNSVLQQIAYSNSSDSPPATVQINWTFSDGNTGSQGTGGALTATGSTIVNITAVNDVPVNTLPSGFTVNEDGTLSLSGIVITDPDAGSSILSTTLTAAQGTLAATSGGSVTVVGSGTASITLTGTLANLNAYLSGPSQPTYTGAANANGTVQLSIVTSDGLNTGTGGTVAAGTLDYRFQDGANGSEPNNLSSSGGLTGVATDFSVTSLATSLSGSSTTFGVIYTGIVNVTTAGTYTFTVGADDTARLFIDGAQVVFAFFSGGTSGAVSLGAGQHSLELRYAQDSGGAGLSASYSGPDTGTASTPLFSASAVGRLVSQTTTTNITVTAVNDAPVLTSSTGTLPYPENTGPYLIGSTGTISDADSSDFNGGQLTITLTANGLAEDRLTIRNQGTGAGQVGVSGANITYAGVTVGTFNGPVTGGTSLVVTFNASSTPSIAQAVLNNLTYENTSEDPSTAIRTITAYITDGDGGTSNTVTSFIAPSKVNDAPVNTIIGDGAVFPEETVVQLLGSISIADVDAGSGTYTVTLSVTPGAGTLTSSSGGGVTVTGSGTNSIVLTGTLASINNYLSLAATSPVFSTTEDFNGTVSFTLVTNDNGNSGSGGALTDSDTITGSISAVADIADDNVTTNEDTSVTISPLSNDTFENSGRTISHINGTLISSGQTVAITGGNLTLNANGTLTYTPSSNYFGTPSFTYTVTSGGVTETATVNITVTAVNDAPTGSVTIDDTTPTQGQTLTATNTLADADGLGAVTYTWKADGNVVGTGTAYTLTEAEVGKAITVTASYTDGHGTAESVGSLPTAAVANTNDAPTGSITIDDTTPTQGQTLTTSNTLGDADGLGTVTYTWKADGNVVGTGTAYTLTEAEVGKAITVTASYTDGHSTNEAVASAATAAVANVNDAPTGSVTIDDTTPTQGQTLTATNTLADADGLGAVTYTWKADGNVVGTGTAYTLTEAEVGKAITVTASYTDGHGTAESVGSLPTAAVANTNDAPTGSITIDDTTPTQGQTLTTSNTLGDADGLGTVTYTWKADGNVVGTGTAYTLTEAEVGKAITVTASYTDGHSTNEAVASAATAAVANVNDAPTGSVTIDDTTPTQGQTLTATNTLADVDGLGAVTYTWKADGNVVGTGTAYTLTEAEVGKAITVTASYTDGHGTAESVGSLPTAAVANTNDAPTGSVTIDDTTPTQGQTLTTSNTLGDADGLGTVTYTWKADGNVVGTGTAYTLTEAEVGKAITVTASYTDGHGTAESVGSLPTAAVANTNDAPTGSITIDDTTPTQGQTLTTSNTLGDADGLGTVTYTWKADGNVVGTGTAYTLTEAEVGKAITVTASYTDGHSTNEAVASAATAAVANVNDAPTGSVTIDDTTPTQGQTLTATNTLADVDGLGAVTYTWKADGNVVGTGTAYTLTEAEVGKAITVTASYTDGHGTAESVGSLPTAAVANTNDAPTGSVTIDDTTPTQGQTLTTSNTLGDADGLGTVTYTWKADGNVVGTGTAYTLTEAEVGKAITVTASYTDGHGTAESVGSLPTAAVANTNDAPTGSVTIDDTTPTQGQTLTASNTLGDADGLGTVTYTWKADGNVVGTGTAYTLAEAEVGKAITVTASYTDGHSTNEAVASAATAAVANVNDAPTGSVTIDDTTPTQGQTLTATNTLADVDGLGAVTYTWKADGNVVGTGTAYTLTEAEVGKAITVTASYTDGHGTAESVGSLPTAAVANTNDAPTGSVTIDDTTPTQGQTLTTSNTLGDADGLGTVTYTWKADGNVVGTGTAYTMTEAEVGKAITVTASYTDGHGTAESVGSLPTAAVANTNDAPTGSVTIDDTTPTQGQTLTATNTLADVDGLGAVTYTWKADGNVVGTGTAYTLTEAEVGKAITVTASYTDGHGTAESVGSLPTAAVANTNDAPTGSVTIDDTTPTQGQTLTTSNTLGDADGLGTVTYTWKADGNVVGTGTAYTMTEAEVGKAITVTASYTDGHGTAESVGSLPTAAVANTNDAPTGSITIDDTTPTQGQTLTASNTLGDADGLGTVTYTWKADGNVVGTGTAYTLAEADVGKAITVTASYTDGHGTNEAVASAATAAVANVNDAPTGSVTIDDTTPTQGQTLTATNTLADVDGLGAVTYTWKADGNVVGTGTAYTLAEADVGKVVTVTASYTDGHGTNEAVASAATAAVANTNDNPTGAVTIDDTTPTQGQTLTASNTLGDADGLGTVTYTWKADGNVVGTGTAYTLTEAEVGKAITVTASYTDGHGTAESVGSLPTAAVANTNDAPTGSVTIDDTTPTQGQTLTASNTLGDADGLGTVTYTWKADGNVVGTGTAYTLAEADVGKAITVTASYTDGHGTNEAVASAATAAVANVNDAPTGSVTIDDTTPTQGQTLTATNTLADVDGLGAVTYTWKADGNVVGTGTAYTLAEADVGKVVTVTASYTDGHGTNEAVASAATAAVANTNDNPTGAVTIDDTTPTQGQTLTASNTLADADGLGSITYTWKADGNVVGTGTAYTLTEAEVGKAITVTASYTDGHGTPESVASAPTPPVANTNDAPTSKPVTLTAIKEDSGVRLITQTELLANATDVDGDVLTATGLVINSGNGTLINNGNGTWTYTPALNDNGNVSFSYTIADGNGGSVASSASLFIIPVYDPAIIKGTTFGLINTIDAQKFIGSLSITDVDNKLGTVSFLDVSPTISKQGYGIFSLANGIWTYKLTSDNPAVQSLKLGESLTDSFVLTASNGLTQVITVVIAGANSNNVDPPYIIDEPVKIDDKDKNHVHPDISDPAIKIDVNPKNGSTKGTMTPNNTQTIRDINTYVKDLIKNKEGIYHTAYDSFADRSDYGLTPDQAYGDTYKQNLVKAEIVKKTITPKHNYEVTDIEFWDQLNRIKQGFEDESLHETNNPVEVQILFAASVGLTAGFVSWILRGGSLLASFMSTVPLLNKFDPVPVLRSSKKSVSIIDKNNDLNQDDFTIDSETDALVKNDEPEKIVLS